MKIRCATFAPKIPAAPLASNRGMRIFSRRFRSASCDGATGAAEHYVAARGGVLRVRDGEVVEIATREAVVNDDLEHLRREILTAMAHNLEAERSARSGALGLEQAAIRQIYRYLRPADRPLKAEPLK